MAYSLEVLDRPHEGYEATENMPSGGYMDHNVEKLLYSRRDAAEALSLSIRSVDYLITTGRLSTRRVGSKILIPAGAIRRFAKEDHPESVRSSGEHGLLRSKKKPPVSVSSAEDSRSEASLQLDQVSR